MYSPQGGLGDLISATTDGTYCPFFVIPSSMADVFGIPAGTYPATGGALDNTTSSTTVQTYNYAASGGETTALVTTSSYTPLVGASPYRKVYYKPSNHQFANQGAVTGSSYITRKIYNAVTSNTAAYLTAYGSSVANEMVYGINDSQRATLKSRMGVQTACVPVFAIGAGGEVAMSSSCRYRSRR
jgi:hypothetical protein